MTELSWSFLPNLMFFIFFIISNINIDLAAPTRHLCRPDQKDALLAFKNEFRIHRRDNDISNSYPKTESWKDDEDCCAWDGVSCDSVFGRVIGLDLSFSLLNGALKTNSSLFRLQYLRSLNLGANNFSSELPNSIGDIKLLSDLDLYGCNIFGQIPSSIGNLTYLDTLDLSGNSFNGEIPSSISNLIRLTRLDLTSNKLDSKFPLELLNLTELFELHLSFNQFFGPLPSNISRLSKLGRFDVIANSFSGSVPSSLFMIRSLISIYLGFNDFTGPLDLGNGSSYSHLEILSLGYNNFHGPIPSSISKLVGLKELDLSFWNTRSLVDFNTFTYLKLLSTLSLSYLNTKSTCDLNIFSHLTPRSSYSFSLDLSGTNVYINSSLTSLPLQIDILILSGCNISEFPVFLMSQTDLQYLDLSNNKIQGQVPEWLWKLPSLEFLNISQNYFNDFEGSLDVIRESHLNMLDISSNAFHGPVPTLSKSPDHFLSSNNHFSGEIPLWICQLTNLQTLDLSNNNFSGSIPYCFDNLKSNLVVLHLQNNSLTGNIPLVKAHNLVSLNLGHNRLIGKLPQSLISCSVLQYLNVEHNKINDEFPFWLQLLPELRILVLRSNEFYGSIYSPRFSAGFPMLMIIDISQNRFTEILPSNYFANWSAMAVIKDHTSFIYMVNSSEDYDDSVVVTNKGLSMELVGSSFTIYRTIDFSGNRFEGSIPESIGVLKEVNVVNMSNNAFTGHIPLSLGNLTKMESLDLSQNNLSGAIPQELGNISFPSHIDFSHNNLVGPIPQSTQFRILPCSAFSDNPGLYGPPLGESCGGVNHVPTPQQPEKPEPEDDEEEEIISWIAVGIGAAPGLVFGLTLGHIIGFYMHEWFRNIILRIKGRSSSGN